MSAIWRGARNAVRSPGRTLAVTVILGLSLALALSMAVAKQAVDGRVADANENIDNVVNGLATTLLVRPAGTGGFGGGGFNGGGPGGQSQQQPTLNGSTIASLSGLANVAAVDSALTAQLQTTDTSLASAISMSPPGGRGGGNFTLPIQAIGTTGLSLLANLGIGTLDVVAGLTPDLLGEADEALVGAELAGHNSLSVGSTFTLYNQTLTVAGLTAAGGGNRFANNSLVLPLATLQRLAGREDQVSTAVVRVDTASNLDSVQAAATAAVGNEADVVNLLDQGAQSAALANAESTVASLEGVSGLAMTSLVGALGAAVVIVFLTMTMVVRERRREIGVLKAIGAPNRTIVAQYATEAMVLTSIALVVGLGLALLFGNTVTHALVSSNASDGGEAGPGPGPGGGGFNAMRFGGDPFGVSSDGIDGSLDPVVAAVGLASAFLVAALGSILPTLAIARVRPSEVLRGE